MEGRTTASFRCPCSDVAAPARHSFWVELVGLAGFPALLHGRCFRCRDKWVAVFKVNCKTNYLISHAKLRRGLDIN